MNWRSILVIPDTQVKPGVDTSHIAALSNYILAKRPNGIILLGDHWDMPSLSSYDKGKRAAEGRRYYDDIEAGRKALDLIDKKLERTNWVFTRQKKKKYSPEKDALLGNHEQRIVRYVEDNPSLEGTIGYHNLELEKNGWRVHDFLVPVERYGIWFSHYFVNPDSAYKKPFSSAVQTQLKTLGYSFVQGHKQGLHQASPRYLSNGKVTRGIIAGSFYSHQEDYLGPQGNDHWRGAIMLNEVDGTGWFTPVELSIEWLLKKYG